MNSDNDKPKFRRLEERWAEEAKGPPILQVEGHVRDEAYILDICDRLLGMTAERQTPI